MKLMIASDIHGSAYYCRKMLDAYKREGADRLLLLGDILYHGPRNDLPKDYAPKEVIAMLNPMKEELLCVRGNCDTEVDQMVLEFPILADYCFLEIDGRTIFASHGHHHNPKNPPMLKKGDKVNIDFKPCKKKTTPPRHYTIETLNKYLKNPFEKYLEIFSALCYTAFKV